VVDGAGNRINLGGVRLQRDPAAEPLRFPPSGGHVSSETPARRPATSPATTGPLKGPRYNAQRRLYRGLPEGSSSSKLVHNREPTTVPSRGSTELSRRTRWAYKARAGPLPSSLSGREDRASRSPCGAPGGPDRQPGPAPSRGWAAGQDRHAANAWSGAPNSVTSLGFGFGLVDATATNTIHGGLVPGQRLRQSNRRATAGLSSRNMVKLRPTTVRTSKHSRPGRVPRRKTYNF